MNDEKQAEEWLLQQVESAHPDIGGILTRLADVNERQGMDAAQSLAQFVESALADKGRKSEALQVLRLRTGWAPAIEFRRICVAAAQKILGNSAESRAFLKNCGLEQRVPLIEALDRLELLRALKPGALCFEKTWGFGVVREISAFDEKVRVDFDRKPDHEMAMGYAAQTLELLDETHILAMNHADPEGLQEMVREDPAQVVRLALRSYGPLNAGLLQEKLSPTIVPATGWKTFWAAARKELKKDPDAVLPSKRTEPILLKDAAGAYGESWFRQLKTERDIEVILARLTDWMALKQHVEVDPLHRAVIEDRLEFVMKGADLMGKTLKPRAMMIAHAVGSAEHLGVQAYVSDILQSDHLRSLLEALSAKDMKRFIDFLLSMNRAAALPAFIRLIPRLDVSSLGEVLEQLIREGEEEACRSAVKGLIKSRQAEVELLSWLSRNMDRLADWDLCAPGEFAEVVLLEMEKDYTGARLKAQNQLRDRFTQKQWVRALFDAMGTEGRERYFLRLKDSSAWPTMEKRSVLGHIIKLYPELERLMTSRGESGEAPASSRGAVTSIRSFRERQLLAERIKTVDIPNNSKEIAVARSYGDLRENFEYKAAKEMQGILMRRQAELQQMLAKVVPTEFDNMPNDKVGPGTGVVIEYADGRTEMYYILGVWDRDETLGIISCESKLALALEGNGPGDAVQVPTEHGVVTGKVRDVTSLPDTVMAWIRDVPETLEGRSITA